MRKKVNFVSWVRAFAVICILVCHLVPTSGNLVLSMSAQFFNIGVELFIIISGFCFGLQGRIIDTKSWFVKRFKRIYVPYELFVLLLAIIYIILGKKIGLSSWIWCISGLMVPIKGITHAWFVATILICYCVTPVLGVLRKEGDDNNKLIAILFCIPFVIAFFPNKMLAAYLPHVFFYACGYLIGTQYVEKTYSTRKVFWLISVALVSGCVRLGGRFFLDGTVWYDNIIVIYTQYIIAICIFELFETILNRIEPKKYCEYICKISFEVYLCHYMFIVGPLSLMQITDFWLVNCMIVIVITFLFAIIMNCMSGKVLEYLK